MYDKDYQPPGEGCPIINEQHTRAAWIADLRMRSGALALTVIINILLLYLFQTAGAWLLIRQLRATGFSLLSLDIINELYTTLVYIAAFFLPYLVYAKAVRYDLARIPREPPHPPVLVASTGIFMGISVTGILFSLLVSAVFSVFGLYPADIPLILPEDPLAAVLFILNTTAVPALIEEFVNRGIILGSLRRFGDRFAIVVSSLIFALLHRNMSQIPNAFLLGLALGYFVVKTNSIWTGMVLHFVNNLMALFLSFTIEGMGTLQILFLEGFVFLLYLVACGCGFLYFLAVRRVDMSLFPSGCPVEEKSLYRNYFLNFPAIMLLLLFLWVIHLNFV